ncbi:MAG: hypothetical protein Q7S85_03720 [Rugosibacter sp.]|nr:hypothetical protein [Rugosibacter sp.]
MTINSKTLGWAGLLGIMMGWGPQALAEFPAGMVLTKAEQSAAFKAAGAVQRKGVWVICGANPDSGASPGTGRAEIETVLDLNGDGRPEAVVTDGGTYCYGAAGVAFTLLSKQADNSWRVMASNTGMAGFLKTRGVDGWPDISVGGPGFCFPVERWNGKEYKLHHFEYEGKRCKPPR